MNLFLNLNQITPHETFAISMESSDQSHLHSFLATFVLAEVF